MKRRRRHELEIEVDDGVDHGASGVTQEQQQQQQQQQRQRQEGEAEEEEEGLMLRVGPPMSPYHNYLASFVLGSPMMFQQQHHQQQQQHMQEMEGGNTEQQQVQVRHQMASSSSSSSSSSSWQQPTMFEFHDSGVVEENEECDSEDSDSRLAAKLEGKDNETLYQELFRPDLEWENPDVVCNDADWFLEILEAYHERGLTPLELNMLKQSRLRKKRKHRHSILFFDDKDLVLNTEHRVDVASCTGKGGKSEETECFGRLLIRASCRVIVRTYTESLKIRDAQSAGCIWSALMDRVCFNIVAAGYSAEVRPGQSRSNESTLFVENYSISRSNLRKIIIECRKELKEDPS